MSFYSEPERMGCLYRVGTGDDAYAGEGYTLLREYGTTPNGNDMRGHWVLRDSCGAMLDFDQYRNDLAERFGLKLSEKTEQPIDLICS